MSASDEFADIESDDELLDAIAAGAELSDADAAAQLLIDIVVAVEVEKPDDKRGPGGGGSRRAVWGITLGVAIIVAAGGGLSAAARTGIPAPVQAVVGAVGGPLIDSAPLPSITLRAGAAAPNTDSTARDAAGAEQTAPRPAAQNERWRTFVWREFAAADGGRAVSPWQAGAVPSAYTSRNLEPYYTPSLWQPLGSLDPTEPARTQSAPAPVDAWLPLDPTSSGTAPAYSWWSAPTGSASSTPTTGTSSSGAADWWWGTQSQSTPTPSPSTPAAVEPTPTQLSASPDSGSAPTAPRATHDAGWHGTNPARNGGTGVAPTRGGGTVHAPQQPAGTPRPSPWPSTSPGGGSWHPQWQSGGTQADRH